VFRDLGKGAESFEFELNGQKLEVTGCSPNLTLLEYLRQSGRTGSKEGCAEGDCGACSVVIVDRDALGKSGYRTINSCLVPLPSLANRRVFTVEGLAKTKLHPVQQAMVDHHGSQCGYCTPGFVMIWCAAISVAALVTGQFVMRPLSVTRSAQTTRLTRFALESMNLQMNLHRFITLLTVRRFFVPGHFPNCSI
jgi:xanthine dehydrogenase iron-sulfur cluster and FAD-binding subunit A